MKQSSWGMPFTWVSSFPQQIPSEFLLCDRSWEAPGIVASWTVCSCGNWGLGVERDGKQVKQTRLSEWVIILPRNNKSLWASSLSPRKVCASETPHKVCSLLHKREIDYLKICPKGAEIFFPPSWFCILINKGITVPQGTSIHLFFRLSSFLFFNYRWCTILD